MEKEIQYKNNPYIESKKRLSMAYLAAKNPEFINTIQKTKGYFFHGTNANALPRILKYGLNSVDESAKNNINVNTGEEWSRFEGKRNFISLTDSLNEALKYAQMTPGTEIAQKSLLNFGVIIGTSFENMTEVKANSVNSDISEIGVEGNLSIDHIKFLAVPEDKVEIVKKIVENQNIDVVSLDIQDKYLNANYKGKLDILEGNREKDNNKEITYPTYYKKDVRPLVKQRRTSKIKEIFEELKAKIKTKFRQTDDKEIEER